MLDLTPTKLIVQVPLTQKRRLLSTGNPGIYIEDLGVITQKDIFIWPKGADCIP